ncbi:hypothetical protein [Bacillus sp. EB600]|uniref:hypothetical protein n=1 Tax=Bacillus sp. EB600 TaxID=2806345 RepID=UPI00210D2E73|nr:hypothetical protein [Bacillus sp. EB600]MCQ6281905.1 hypothetical protein [Bacillus sp. EB600]
MEFLLLYIFLAFSLMLFMYSKKIYVGTAAMAAVMAFGITTQGVLFNFFGSHFFYSTGGRILSILDLALWSSFVFSFALSYFNKKFKEVHYSNLINRFGMGTWVAGTSICGILVDKQFNEWEFFVKIILCINVALWAFYIWICLRTLADVRNKRLTKSVHGVLLLTTVSTQSLVLFASTVYKGVPLFIDLVLITIGIAFYFVSAILIIKRYSSLGTWSIRTDWNNTNCILHGALSITGLACLVSHLLTNHSVMIIWFCSALVFLIVELIELYRLIDRINFYGWKRAILVYDVSQWSRVFTFAMFYTFTYLSGPNLYFISLIRKTIIISGIWLVLLLAIFEIGLVVKYLSGNHPTNLKRSSSDGIDPSF